MCCATASQLGPQAANTVLSRVAGTEPAVLEYGFAGNSCTSLGRRGGIVQFGRNDNRPIDASFWETEIEVTLETRDVAMVNELTRSLVEAGYGNVAQPDAVLAGA